MIQLPALPIVEVLPELRDALSTHRSVVLEAPPGAGKSTVVPLALLESDWRADGRILMLEPRRIAARAVAARMAAAARRGARPDGRLPHAARDPRRARALASRSSPRASSPACCSATPRSKASACVIFDEFHERNLHGDLGLALSAREPAPPARVAAPAGHVRDARRPRRCCACWTTQRSCVRRGACSRWTSLYAPPPAPVPGPQLPASKGPSSR